MKSYLVLVLLYSALCIVDKDKHQKIVNFINKLRTTWTAKLYERDVSPLMA